VLFASLKRIAEKTQALRQDMQAMDTLKTRLEDDTREFKRQKLDSRASYSAFLLCWSVTPSTLLLQGTDIFLLQRIFDSDLSAGKLPRRLGL
jgi:hypothetical protein